MIRIARAADIYTSSTAKHTLPYQRAIAVCHFSELLGLLELLKQLDLSAIEVTNRVARFVRF